MVDSVITLFDSTSIDFTTNGLGSLRDAVSCLVAEERNGNFELEMEYPITGKRYNDVSLRSIIFAKPNPYSSPQPFRIYSITKPINGIVTISAAHISYDLTGYPVSPFTANTTANAFVNLKNASVINCPFTFTTDKTDSKTLTVSKPSSMKSVLGGADDSILGVYGGEYEFDNYNVKLWNNRGTNRGVSIRYGKNLTDLEQEENCNSVYTGVYPYWYSEQDGLVHLNEGYISVAGTYDYTRICPLDLSQYFEEAPTESELRSLTQTYISVNNIGIPKVSLTVSFVQLTQSEEYESFAVLETIHLCDIVNVEFLKLNVSTTAKCIKTIYNAITGKYDKIELGEVKSDIASTISRQSKRIKDSPTEASVNRAINNKADEIKEQVESEYLKIDNLDASINTYIDSTTGTAKIVSACTGTYQTKSDMGDYSTTTEMNTAITQQVSSEKASILSTVSGTYQTKDGMGDYLKTVDLNTSIGQYIDSTTGTAKIVSACTGTYQTKSDMGDYVTTSTMSSSITQEVNSKVASLTLETSESTSGNQTTSTIKLKNGTTQISSTTIVGTTAAQASTITTDAINGITMTVTNGTSSSQIVIKNGSTTITSGTVQFTGNIVFKSDLSTSGSTTINGSNITTGTISADRIDVSSLKLQILYTSDNRVAIYGISSNLYIGNSTPSISGNTWASFSNVYISASSSIEIGTSSGSSLYFKIDISNYKFYHMSASSSLGTSSYRWGTAYIKTLYLGSDSTAFDPAGTKATKMYAGSTSSTYYIELTSSRELVPSTASTSYPFYLGTSAKPWTHAYIGNVVCSLGAGGGKLGFFGTTPIARQTLSTSSNNMSYTTVTASNYLYALNNLIGILKNKYGLIL
jgi:phage minor structural protein